MSFVLRSYKNLYRLASVPSLVSGPVRDAVLDNILYQQYY